ncbi:MAG: bacteriocin family protein [Defluviitaleaceae bacterium]|nr:bacteriocin family protein [Defluviitaleaceae bacterium]MCL2261681.1 bacteriocin family protein [Defluviitaleaceae bacterium]
MTPEQILQANGLGGSIAQRLIATNMDISMLRTNAILQKDDWVDLDRRVVKVAQERLSAVSDLVDRDLIYELGGLGKTVSQWQTEGDMSDATVSMEPDSDGIRDLLNLETDEVPVPIIHKDFRLGARQLAAGRESGSPIDMTNADAATRKVAVGMEDLVISGSKNKFSKKPIYGYITHPFRSQIAFVDIGGILQPITVDNFAELILQMIQEADDKDYYGPFILYVPTGLSTILYKIIPNTNGKMLKQHLEEIDLIEEVKVSSRMPKGNLALVQMSSDNVDLAIGQPLIPVEWDEKGGMAVNYKILTAMAPRLKSRQDKTLGVVHAKFKQNRVESPTDPIDT